MTAVTATSSVSRSAPARPNASERFLLRLSSAIESATIARMQRRAASAGSTRNARTPAPERMPRNVAAMPRR